MILSKSVNQFMTNNKYKSYHLIPQYQTFISFTGKKSRYIEELGRHLSKSLAVELRDLLVLSLPAAAGCNECLLYHPLPSIHPHRLIYMLAIPNGFSGVIPSFCAHFLLK